MPSGQGSPGLRSPQRPLEDFFRGANRSLRARLAVAGSTNVRTAERRLRIRAGITRLTLHHPSWPLVRWRAAKCRLRTKPTDHFRRPSAVRFVAALGHRQEEESQWPLSVVANDGPAVLERTATTARASSEGPGLAAPASF